jgi:nucleotide-binding universal stress UspA family protein
MLPTIERILYCTELGPNTAYVFRYAYAMACRFEAELMVLHVVDALTAEQRRLVDDYAGQGKIEELIEAQEDEQLQRIPRRIAEFCAREIGDDDWCSVVTRIVVAEGKAPRVILDHVASLKADLVIMGAHSEESLLERLVGSTAHRVVARSPVPVMLCQVPEGHQELSLEI